MTQPNNQNAVRDFIVGILEVIVVDIALMIMSGLSSFIPPMLAIFLGIGVFQLLYVIPRVVWLIRQQKWNKMKGMVTAAVIVLLLNGACWLLVFQATRR